MSSDGQDGWFTSSYTNGGGSCVEVKFGDDCIFVRDSKDRRAVRPIVGFSSEGWCALLKVVTGRSM